MRGQGWMSTALSVRLGWQPLRCQNLTGTRSSSGGGGSMASLLAASSTDLARTSVSAVTVKVALESAHRTT